VNHAQALSALHGLYRQIPALACQGRCTEACGPLGLSQLEFVQIQRATPLRLAEGKTTACPLLKRGRCTVYATRPMICRLWGVVESMPCVWGCRPERYLTVDEADSLMREAEQLSQALFPDASPRTFHTDAMIERVQERGAQAVAWAVLATVGRSYESV
jgi:uncharacterized protein